MNLEDFNIFITENFIYFKTLNKAFAISEILAIENIFSGTGIAICTERDTHNIPIHESEETLQDIVFEILIKIDEKLHIGNTRKIDNFLNLINDRNILITK